MIEGTVYTVAVFIHSFIHLMVCARSTMSIMVGYSCHKERSHRGHFKESELALIL